MMSMQGLHWILAACLPRSVIPLKACNRFRVAPVRFGYGLGVERCGQVRVVGSDGFVGKGGFLCILAPQGRKGAVPAVLVSVVGKTVPAVPVSVFGKAVPAVPVSVFGKFRFPVPVRFLGLPADSDFYFR